ncbi:MAG: glycoside hydrolase, partial [Actinomycetota bacterium]|nr:glycoside hydrolase [Actinomycetota bacterium]
MEADVRGDQACTTHISTDDGRSWAPGGELMVKPFLDCTIGAEYGAYASPAFGSDGTLYVAFIGSEFLGRLRDDTPRHLSSTDQGRRWTDAVEVDPGNQRSGSPRPHVLAADPRTGTLYTAWYSNTEPNNLAPAYEGDLEIFFRRSTDGGRTWGQRVVLNDDRPGKANQFLPGIAVAPNGRVDVAWYDGRLSPKPRAGGTGGNETGFQDVYATSSTDQGVTFGPNLRITDRSIDRSVGVVEQHRQQPRRGCD